jgi:Abortive infection C-terminus
MAVLHLYSRRSGAQDFTLQERKHSGEWEAFRRTVIRYMRERGDNPQVIERFEKTPFELWRGTNDFGDDFEVLYVKVGMDSYIQLEHEVGHQLRVNAFDVIAEVMDRFGRPVRFIAAELEIGDGIAPVQAPTLEITSEAVESALKEAETLIGTHGAPSGIDRAHTALHGYLEAVCHKAGIAFKEDANVTELFGRIRDEHPSLRHSKPGTKSRIDNSLRGMARIMDALGLIRNQNSLAHPNPVLLDEADAMLAINLMRTMLHYLNERTRAITSP